MFEQFCPKTTNANSLVAEPETDFNAKWPFKVIQGHLFRCYIEEPLWVYIAQYNNCALRCEGSEDMAGKISENRHFRGRHSHLKPLSQRTPRNIGIRLISLETAIHGLHFCR